MEICLFPATLQSWTGDVLMVGMFEGKMEERFNELETVCKGSLMQSLEKQMFKGKSGEIATVQLLQNKPNLLVLVGLGEPQKMRLDDLRKAAALGAKASLGCSGTLGMMLPWEPLDAASAARAVAEAVRLSLYKDLRFRSAPEPRSTPTKLELIGLPDSAGKDLQAVHPTCAGVELARQLVAAPANSLTPAALAQTAIQLAHEHGLECTVLERSDCAEREMGAYLAVSQGSDLEPKFIHLTYRPQGPVQRRLALVGKGLTFDSGGYNLKVGAAQIDLMKFDMGGSAAVLGAARAIAELRPKGVEVHVIVAACENMVNGSAVHPGDIVRASNGTTIEINNTDAEGRLTLADALVYTCGLEPDAIVDLATLTGACVIALGEEIAGLWTGHDPLAEGLTAAAEAAGEGLWRMPLPSSYREGLKSNLADLKNTGPRPGGSITAALFLKEFVEASIPWAHIDIAGTVWSEKGRGLNPSGATGYGVRTLVNWICNQS